MILRALQRRDDLYRLTAWAKRKRLKQPLPLYEFRLIDEERRIGFYVVRYSSLMPLAYLLFNLYKCFAPRRRYYPRGAAATYRRMT